jgi:hypothetical protein
MFQIKIVHCRVFLGAFAKLRKRLLTSSCLSVCPSAWNNAAPTGRVLMKFDIWGFFENLSRKFKFHENRKRIKGTLHEDRYSFFIISRKFLLRMINVADKNCRENQNTNFMGFFFYFFLKSCRLWDSVEEYCRKGWAAGTMWRTRIACCVPEGTNTHSCFVILIAFTQQQWLRERASVLSYTYIACLVYFIVLLRNVSFHVVSI